MEPAEPNEVIIPGDVDHVTWLGERIIVPIETWDLRARTLVICAVWIAAAAALNLFAVLDGAMAWTVAGWFATATGLTCAIATILIVWATR